LRPRQQKPTEFEVKIGAISAEEGKAEHFTVVFCPILSGGNKTHLVLETNSIKLH